MFAWSRREGGGAGAFDDDAKPAARPLLRRAAGAAPVQDGRGTAATDLDYASPYVDEARASTGEALPPGVDAHIAATLGVELPGIVAHTDGAAADAAAAANARAFTVGDDIFFGAGEFAPGTAEGDRLIAHEAAHVQQHREGRVVPDGSRVTTAEHPLEVEADRMATRAPDDASPTVLPATHAVAGGPALRHPKNKLPGQWPRVTGAATGAFTDEALDDLATRLMGLGIRADAIGDLGFHASWTDEHINHAFRTLEQIIHGSEKGNPKRNGRFGNEPQGKHPGRLVQSWNVKMDDIGAGNYGKYATILAYVDRLDEISNQTLGGDYEDKIGKLPDVRIAGLRTGVHPRAVYFAAAAQVIMDDKAAAAADADRDPRAAKMKRAEGQGHYVPVGGFDALLREIRAVLTKVAYSRKTAGVKSRTDQQRTTGVDDGAVVYAALRAEIERMMIALDAQAKGDDVAGFEAADHREPAMRAFLLPKRAAVDAVVPPTDDADSARAARELLVALGINDAYMDRKQLHHGGGSIDPHGTDHAIGNAVDIYNSTGPVHRPNMGIREPAHWQFVYKLIDMYGAQFGIDRKLRPSSLDALDPDVAQRIAELIRARGPQEAETIATHAKAVREDFRDDKDAAKEHQSTVKGIEALRRQITDAFGKRASAIRGLGDADKKHLPAAPMPELQAVGRFMSDINKVMATQSPARMAEILGGVLGRLGGLRGEIMPVLDGAEEAAEERHQQDVESAGGRADFDRDVSNGELRATESEVAADQTEIDEQLQDLDDEIAHAGDAGERRTLEKRRADPLARSRRLAARLAAARKDHTSRQKRIEAKAKAERARLDRAAARADAPRAKTEATIAKIMPEPDPLAEVLATLQGDADHLQVTHVAQQDLLTESLVKGAGFQRWLQEISDEDSVIFDQPKIMVDALNEAGPGNGNFQGSHHWMVMPRETLLDDTKYGDALYADMAKRDEPHLRRILEIMAESDGGRAILFPGADDPQDRLPDQDPQFEAALDKRCAELSTTRAAVLAGVRGRVITPFEGGDASSGIKRDMARLGHRIP